jgi:hypothetical protein
MELGSKKTSLCLIVLMAATALQAQEFRVEHKHWRKSCAGTLAFTAAGVSYTGEDHNWTWTFDDIEQLQLSEQAIRVTTYVDRRLKLGADQQETFLLEPDQTAASAYETLSTHLGQRLVAALAIAPKGLEIPAKLIAIVRGTQGSLFLGDDTIAFKSDTPEASRTWRFTDIDNMARTGPYRLTITTFERGHNEFQFQLKRPLAEDQYDKLWLRLNQTKGLKILTSYKEN